MHLGACWFTEVWILFLLCRFQVSTIPRVGHIARMNLRYDLVLGQMSCMLDVSVGAGFFSPRAVGDPCPFMSLIGISSDAEYIEFKYTLAHFSSIVLFSPCARRQDCSR